MSAFASVVLAAAALSETSVTLSEASTAGAPGKAFLAATIIKAPMARLCAIIQDYPGYPGFMPSVAKTVVTRAPDGDALVDMSLKLPLGKSKQYRLKMTPAIGAQQCRLAWKLVPVAGLKQEDTIADTTGYWQLAPVSGDAGRTVVQYYVYTDPGPVPLGAGWIVDSMSKDSLPKTLEALRTKAR